jgi:thioredoxin reductase
MKAEDVIIIGAGPAGIAAAIQLRRQGINPVVFEKDMIGGLLRNANLVENYPGFPGGISGVDLVALFEKQLAVHTMAVIPEEVANLDFADGIFIAQTPAEKYYSRMALVASGTKPKEFTDIEIPSAVRPRVHYEVYPILKEENKRIVIVGAGDAAFDYALNLQKHNEVTIINRCDSSRCLPLLRKRAEKSDSIRYHDNTRISEIRQNSGGQIRIQCMTPDETAEFDADFLVFAIGRDPRLDFLSKNLRQAKHALEQEEILYFLGDVKSGIYRQTSIAIGDAVMAAMKIGRKLQEAAV